MPFRRDARGVVEAVIDDEAAAALLRLIIDVAERIAADLAAHAPDLERRAERGAVPPGEDSLEETHGRPPSADSRCCASRRSARLDLDRQRPLAAFGDACAKRLVGNEVGKAAAAHRLHVDEDILP